MRNTQMRPVLEKKPKKNSIQYKRQKHADFWIRYGVCFFALELARLTRLPTFWEYELWSQAVVDDRG